MKLGQDHIGRGQLRPGPDQAEGMPEGPARPRGIGGDFHDHRLHQGERDGFLVPVEPVEGRALHGGGPGVLTLWRFQPSGQVPGIRGLQRGGPAHDPQFILQDQAGDDLRGLGDRSDDGAADDVYGFPVFELRPGADARGIRLVGVFDDEPLHTCAGQFFEPAGGLIGVSGGEQNHTLQNEIQELRAKLQDQEEELGAAREANRQLMSQLNKTAANIISTGN